MIDWSSSKAVERDPERPHDRHHRPTATADDRWAWLDPRQRRCRHELQQQMEQCDQPLAVRMQEAEVACPPEPRNALQRMTGFERIRHHGLLANCRKAALRDVSIRNPIFLSDYSKNYGLSESDVSALVASGRLPGKEIDGVLFVEDCSPSR